MQFYMIYNDTDVTVNVKQFNTEETCPIQPGSMLTYSWRSHKKQQLMQLYLPKYKLTSRQFQINRNGIDEIRLSGATFQISFIIRVETQIDRGDKSLAFMSRGPAYDSYAFKKFVIIQARLCALNMLNLDISIFGFTYSTPTATGLPASSTSTTTTTDAAIDVGPIGKYSRSTHTHALVESLSSLNSSSSSSKQPRLVELSSLRINDLSVSKKADFLNKLINGISLFDCKQNIKYWINLYENQICERSLSSASMPVTQLCLVLTPVLVLCSYLPYELDVKLNNNERPRSIKSNSISYCSSCDFDLNKIEIRFDRLSRGHLLLDDDDEEDQAYKVLYFLRFKLRTILYFLYYVS